jgi:hypothetical protein
MQSQGLIATTFPNQVVDAITMENAFDVFSSCFGYAAAIKGKDGLQRLAKGAQSLPPKMTLEQFNSAYEEVVNKLAAGNDGGEIPQMMLYWGRVPEGTDVDCNQPFVLSSDERGRALLVCCLEGDFTSHATDDSGKYTPEYQYLVDYLQPKISDMLELVDGDVSKVMKALAKDSTVKEILGTMGDKSAITFMDFNGTQVQIETSDKDRVENEWGTISREIPKPADEPAVEEPVEEPAAEPVVEPKKTMTLAERRTRTQRYHQDTCHR